MGVIMGIDLGRFRANKKEEWLDWLADDPVPASLRARMRAKEVERASQHTSRRPVKPTLAQGPSGNTASTNKTVSINISVPKLKRPSLPKKLPANLTYKKLGIGGAALVGIFAIGLIVNKVATSEDKKPTETAVLSAEDQKPDFATVAPKDKDAPTTRYDTKRKVVSFQDSIGGVAITISQQPLPQGLKEDTDNKVKKLAADFAATEVISTSNPTAYLGTSAKGPQTVIFSKKDLLIFIQSTKEIDTHDWAEYITKLE